jgi:hypothetical protein
VSYQWLGLYNTGVGNIGIRADRNDGKVYVASATYELMQYETFRWSQNSNLRNEHLEVFVFYSEHFAYYSKSTKITF